MSKLTGLALLLSGVGIAAYSIPSGEIWSNAITGVTAFSHTGVPSKNVQRENLAARTLASHTAEQSAPAAPKVVIKTIHQVTRAPVVVAVPMLPSAAAPAIAAPRTFSSKQPLLSARPKTGKQIEISTPTQPDKTPWWRFALPAKKMPVKKVEVATVAHALPAGATPNAPSAISKHRADELLTMTAKPRAKAIPSPTPMQVSGSTPLTPRLISTVNTTEDSPNDLKLATTKPDSDKGRTKLARNLQHELRRVGCYAGSIDGNWGPASRHAMKAFTERLNATLPVAEPDYILLTLVQGHTTKACGQPCAIGETLSNGGRCLGSPTIMAQTIAKPKPVTPAISASAKSRKTDQANAVVTASTSAPKTAPSLAAWKTTTIKRSARRKTKRKNVPTVTRLVRAPELIRTPTRRAKRIARRSKYQGYRKPLPGRMAIGATIRPRPTDSGSGVRILSNRITARVSTSSTTTRIEPVQAPAPRQRTTRYGDDVSSSERPSTASVRTIETSVKTIKTRESFVDDRRLRDEAAREVAATRKATKQRARSEQRRRRVARANKQRKSYLGAAKKRSARKRPSSRRRRSSWKQRVFQSQR